MMLDEHNFETLKQCVLHKAGVEQRVPENYEMLADLIFLSTKRRISAKRLKMLYELDYQNTWPSVFILETLSVYCEFESWKLFCENQKF